MTEAKHTPGGYRIDIAKEEKFMQATVGGAELGPVDATDCEMELWRINQSLVKALEAITSALSLTGDKKERETAIRNAWEQGLAALAAAGRKP